MPEAATELHLRPLIRLALAIGCPAVARRDRERIAVERSDYCKFNGIRISDKGGT